MSNALYPVSTIAKLFDITERRVQQLAKDGVIPKPEKGKYELVASVRGYIKYLQERAYGKEISHSDAHFEKTRLLKAQADIAEIELKKLRRKLIAVDDVELEWASLVMAFRSRLLAFPNKAAHAVLGDKKHHEIENKLREMVHEVLTELSKYEPTNGIEQNEREAERGMEITDITIGEKGGKIDSTSTKPKGKRLG